MIVGSKVRYIDPTDERFFGLEGHIIRVCADIKGMTHGYIVYFPKLKHDVMVGVNEIEKIKE